MASGISTPNLPSRTVVDELLGNRTAFGERQTVVIPVANMASLLLQSAPIKALGANAGLYATRAELEADLTPDEPFMGWVYDDPVAANRGIYRIVDGVPKTWEWAMPLPFGVVNCANGGGSANDLTVTTSLPLVGGSMPTIGILPILADNTAAMTINLNGAGAKPLLGAAGTAIPNGGLKAGMLVSFVDAGAAFRLLTDTDSAINRVAAEAAAGVAGTKATEAGNHASAAAADRLVAQQASASAEADAEIAKAAAEASGAATFFDTYAEASAALGGLTEGEVVEVFADETRGGRRTRYRVEGGVLAFKLRLAVGETVLASEFGVIGFNSAAEAEAVDQRALLQAAIDYARASMAGVLELPAGHIAVADELDLFWERATHIEPLTFKGQGTRATALIANFTGVDKAMLRVVNPDAYGDGSDLNMRSTAMTISDMSWRVGSGIADAEAPIFLRYPNASDVRLSRLHANARNNSAIAMSGIFNSIVEDVTIFGGGHTFVRKDADGVTFSINQGATTLTASEAHFTAGDVGRVIKLSGEQQALVIDSVTNGTTAEVVEAAQLASAARAAIWEPTRASIDSATDQLVFENACLAASDVGRWVYVFGARAGNTGGTLGSTSGTRPLRAQITAVSGDFTTATLDRNASATVADTVVVASPVFDISSTELQYNETNDFQISALNIEVFNSCALYIEEGLNLDLRRVKTHGRNVPVSGRPDLVTHFDAVLIRSSGYYRGDVEGFPVNPYGTIFVGDVITALSFDAVTGTSLEGAPGFIYWDNQNSYGSVRVHDLTHNNNLSARQADRIVGTTNPTPAPEVAGNRSWYRSSLRPTQVTATKKVSGFRTALQSFMRAVVGLGTEGFQAIGVGINGIPTFRGSRVRGTEAAPTAVQQYDPLVSIDGEGRADDGEMVVAGRMVLRAKANPAAGNVEGEWLIARRNGAGDFTEVWVLNDDLVPVQDDVSYAGLGTNRLRGAYLGTFGATTELNGAVVPLSTFIRRRGTDGAPSAVLDGDELMRIRAMGRADDGNDVEAARIAAFAYGAPSGGNLRGRLGLFVRTAAGALAEQWRVLEGALRPIGTQNLGAGDARINELHATRLRLYPGTNHAPFNAGEYNMDAPADNRIRMRYRGPDNMERSINFYLDVADEIMEYKGVGSPEGVVTAAIGSKYINKTGGAGQTLWVKETGSGNTGWVAK